MPFFNEDRGLPEEHVEISPTCAEDRGLPEEHVEISPTCAEDRARLRVHYKEGTVTYNLEVEVATADLAARGIPVTVLKNPTQC
ncbi:hypothetical protein PAMA_004761 [Pampus argenteus]